MLKTRQHEYFPEHVDVQFFNSDTLCGKFSIHIEKDCYSIWSVNIEEDYRGKGLGKQMMIECVELLKSLPTKPSAYLTVFSDNTPAVKCYLNAGFAFTGVYEKGHTVKMEIIL